MHSIQYTSVPTKWRFTSYFSNPNFISANRLVDECGWRNLDLDTMMAFPVLQMLRAYSLEKFNNRKWGNFKCRIISGWRVRLIEHWSFEAAL